MLVKRVAWALAIAGAIVFAIVTAFIASKESHIRVPAIASLVTFAMVIVAHVGGIASGLALGIENATDKIRAFAIAWSVLPVLAAWGLFWLPSPQQQIGAALASLVVILAVDLWLAGRGLVPRWFVTLRLAITVAVCAILGVALLLL